MNINQSITEKSNKLQKQIKRMASQYENKDLSPTERNDALRELRMFNEQVGLLSSSIEINLQSKAKSHGLELVNGFKGLADGIEKNINDNIPDSEFI